MRPGRTGTALLLSVAAVVVPCVAWWVYGSRAADEQAARLLQLPQQQARSEASQLADQVALRLESLRLTESRRPFTDYLAAESPYRESCSGEIPSDSPLAQGPADPLIWAHFQLDDVGQLELPTLGSGEAADPAQDDAQSAIQLAIFEELECSSALRSAAGGWLPRTEEEQRLASPAGVVTVGPLSWHTLNIKEQPALVALREVVTPTATLTQGFVLLQEDLNHLVSRSANPATIRPGVPVKRGEVLVSIDGDEWTVAVDTGVALEQATARAAAVERRFQIGFLIGALTALIAGTVVILLVRQADRLARERQRFAASAAHELRTPLAGLQLYGEMLAEGTGDPGKQERYARRVAEEAGRLGRIVTNVLGFTHLERGGVAVDPRPGDLGQAVLHSVERLRPAIEAQGAKVQVQVEDEVPAAIFDADAVHQILQNLLDNAEKYSRDAANRTLEVRLRAGSSGPELSVRDHGQGIAPSVRSKLFRPFTRHTGSRSPAGLGIGLALVQALVRAQNGSILLAEGSEDGAEFVVRFRPAGDEVAGALEPSLPAS